MKNFTKILYASALAALFACNPNKPLQFDSADSFVAFNSTVMAVPEVREIITKDADGKEVKTYKDTVLNIPLTIASVDPVKTSISYQVTGLKNADGVVSKEKVDFTLGDPSAVVTADGQGRSFSIPIKIGSADYGTFTGDKMFKVDILTATGLNLGAASSCVVTIQDLDHPLGDILGDWKVVAVSAFNGPETWTMTFEKDPSSVTSMVIRGIVAPYATATSKNVVFAEVTGAVGSRVVTIPLGQEFADDGDDANVWKLWDYRTDDFLYTDGNLIFTQQKDGTMTANVGWGAGYEVSGNVYLNDLLAPVPPAVLTKQ